MYCEKILTYLGLEKSLQLQNCNLLTEIGLEIPFYEGLGLPPAMIPIANEIGSFSYFGIYISDIISWEYSFVELMIEDSGIYEFGLTEQQFCYYLARRAMLDYYEEDDSELEEKLLGLCAVLGINTSKKIEALTDEQFVRLDVFREGIPKYLQFEKSGSTHGNTGFQEHRMKAIADDELITMFDNALSKKNYQRAWEILNSPGWKLNAAKSKFKALADIIGCELISDLYQEWSNLNHPLDGY